MKIGLFAISYAPCADPEVAVRVARHAEAAGFESVWTGVDRLVLLPQPDASPSQRHAPVPADRILRNIDTAARQIIGS